MKKPILLASLVCVVKLVGCANGPDFKTYSSTLSAPKDGEARVWFYRPSKMMASGVQPIVYVNGTEVGKAQPGCFFYADRPAGTYEVKCKTEWANKTSLTVVQNQVHYIRLTMAPGVFVGHVLPRVVPEEQGMKEIQNCHLITADGRNKDWKAPTNTGASPKPIAGGSN
jgi:hypothetical protein